MALQDSDFGARAVIALLTTGVFVFMLSLMAIEFTSRGPHSDTRDGTPLADLRTTGLPRVCEEKASLGILLGESTLMTILKTGANVHNLFLEDGHSTFARLSLKVPGLCYKASTDPEDDRNLILSLVWCPPKEPRQNYLFKHGQCLYSSGFVAPCYSFPAEGAEGDQDIWKETIMRYQELYSMARKAIRCPKAKKDCPQVHIAEFSCEKSEHEDRSFKLILSHPRYAEIDKVAGIAANSSNVALRTTYGHRGHDTTRVHSEFRFDYSLQNMFMVWEGKT